MKALIEIDEKTFKALHEFVVINTGRSNGKTIIYKCLKAISNGTPIPDNATNKETFKTIFGKDVSEAMARLSEPSSYSQIETLRCVKIDGVDCACEWLNAPYKGGRITE